MWEPNNLNIFIIIVLSLQTNKKRLCLVLQKWRDGWRRRACVVEYRQIAGSSGGQRGVLKQKYFMLVRLHNNWYVCCTYV